MPPILYLEYMTYSSWFMLKGQTRTVGWLLRMFPGLELY